MITYKLLRHPDVVTDLFDIIDLIADYAGKETASHKLAEIEATIRGLGQTPHVGSLRHEIYPKLRAIPTAGKGVISFIVDDDTQEVLIVSVTYAGADWINRARHRNSV